MTLITRRVTIERVIKTFKCADTEARSKAIRPRHPQIIRMCFRWTAGGAEDVEIVDYH